MRTRSNRSPFVDIDPLAPLCRTVERSTAIGVPLDTTLPETCAELAFVAAAFASASTRVAGLDASSFSGAARLELPQPARSTAVRTKARASARIVGSSLSNTIALWTRPARCITWGLRSRISMVHSTLTSVSSAHGSSSARGPGMHHVAYEVDDIRAALTRLSQAGAELIDETPRQGMFGLEVAFVHPES